MEAYRPRGSNLNNAPKLLLPLSFGPASTSLLHILDGLLLKQKERMNRTSYNLVIVHVVVSQEDEAAATERIKKVEERYPRHTYIMSNMTDALSIPDIDWSALHTTKPDNLDALFSRLPSNTSRADVASTLMSQLLIACAKAHDCSTLLYGHSTTRLAEKVLTSTANGRGFSLPWQVRDGASPSGIDIAYPLRDLLSKEITTYTEIASPSFDNLVLPRAPIEVSASSKNTSIDDLMAQYFQSVEENYPSIVANVVRTSSKLQAPQAGADTLQCNLCDLPVEKGTDGIFGWGGDQSVDARERDAAYHRNNDRNPDGILCYGCSRSVNG